MATMATNAAIGVGLVGTGFVATRRAEALAADPRAQLTAVAGRTREAARAFVDRHGGEAVGHWSELVARSDVELVLACSTNADRGAIVRAALGAGKAVVAEYPLALDPAEAAEAIALARSRGLLLHVEHIELLGGVHQALRSALPEVGEVTYARYSTLSPKHPAPDRWTYSRSQFGFPLAGALSRVMRLTDVLGPVATVSATARYWPRDDDPTGDRYRACLCAARLTFASGAIADAVYGKGDRFWRSTRHLAVLGGAGELTFDGDRGTLHLGDLPPADLPVGTRRGAFARDTRAVLDALQGQGELYVTPEASLAALRVADAARQAAETNAVVAIAPEPSLGA